MKVYFTAPLWEKEKNLDCYHSIIGGVEKLGHQVIQDTLDYDAEEILTSSNEFQSKYFQTWKKYVYQMDICIAEISFPCTVNIGFEIASLLNSGKPVIALYRKGKDPKFISPEFSNRMIKSEYNLDDVDQVLEWTLEEAQSWLHRRFTFFIPSVLDNYLDKVSKETGENKSEFIRGLIKKHKQENSE